MTATGDWLATTTVLAAEPERHEFGSPTYRGPLARLAIPGAVCLFALLVRLAYLRVTGHYPLSSDAAQYHQLAASLVHGHGYAETYPQLAMHETAFRPPLYPLLLAFFYWIFGVSAGLGRAVNVCLGIGVVALTFTTVQRHVSHRAAIGASLAVAVMPNLVANDTFTLDEPLALILILLLLNLLLSKRWLWSGAVTGLLVLTRPSAQYLVLVVWVIAKANWKRALAFGLAALVVISPWLIRNWVQLGSPVIATSNGFNWAATYSPPAQRAGQSVDPIYDPYFNSMRIDQFDEVVWNDKLQSIGVQNLERHPTILAHVVARNVLQYFDLRPSLSSLGEKDDGRDLAIVDATLWIFYADLIAGVAGPWLLRRRQLVQLVTVQAAYFGLASLLFIAAPRLRAPVDLALAIGVGCLVEWAMARRQVGVPR